MPSLLGAATPTSPMRIMRVISCLCRDGKLRERGQPETLHNLIAPAVDGVLGMEAKTRTDLMVTADEPDDQIEALAEGLNSLFADAARLGRLDKARSEAYAGQIKCGIGLVEVYRNPNLLGARYKIKYVLEMKCIGIGYLPNAIGPIVVGSCVNDGLMWMI